MFYTYRQNNSGGKFKGPALYVCIEADSPKEANIIALKYIYFGGRGDCPCCGDRWSEQWDCEEGFDFPHYYGKPLTDRKDEYKIDKRWASEAGAFALIVYKDGKTEKLV